MYVKMTCFRSDKMSRTRSTALERLVIQLLGGLNRFYGIPTLALGPGMVHLHRSYHILITLKHTLINNGQLSPSSLSTHRIHNQLSTTTNTTYRHTWTPQSATRALVIVIRRLNIPLGKARLHKEPGIKSATDMAQST